jgi:P pilus assembly chaperone PapD
MDAMLFSYDRLARRLGRFLALAGAVLTAIALPGLAHAQVGADLNISPKRVVFSPGERSATVYIFNQGDSPATYTVELVDRVMLPDGQIAESAQHPEVDVASAAELVQYTPRRVVLQPRESQSIRVRALPAPNGEDVEYRTHLTVTAVPPESTGLTAEAAARGEDGELSLQVTALFSVSIPVILRTGEADARATLDNLRLAPPVGEQTFPMVALDLVRLGANSVYGDVEIRDGVRMVGLLRGVAVYPEVERRAVTVPLAEAVTPGTVLTVTYRDDDAHAGQALATASLAVP